MDVLSMSDSYAPRRETAEWIRELEALGWDRPDMQLRDQVASLSRESNEAISYPESLIEEGAKGFWTIHRGRIISRLLKTLGVQTLWEVGAGSGALAEELQMSGIQVVCIEPLAAGVSAIAERKLPTFNCTLQHLRLPESSLEAVGLFDVVEHIDNPSELILEIHRILRPGGVLLVSVPAYEWMWSAADESLGHFRRYSKGSLIEAFESQGFSSLQVRYAFGALVPPAFLLRVLPYRWSRLAGRYTGDRRHSSRDPQASLGRQLGGSGVFNSILLKYFDLEEKAFQARLLPAGLTLVGVFQKNGADIPPNTRIS